MNNYSIAFGCACFALVFIMSGISTSINRIFKRPLYARIKPFDCELCLSFWIGIVSSIYFGKNIVEIIYIGSIAAIIAQTITVIYHKLNRL
jgi:uncharacterized BrkB/YihY/UPF0761 family membrane protein